MQALDRTHRLGQHRTITAVRFVVAGECPDPVRSPVRLPARMRMHMHAYTPTRPHAHALRAPLPLRLRPSPRRAALCAGTVEERIIALQRKKQQVFEATVGGGKDAIGKLSAEDMAFLFS